MDYLKVYCSMRGNGCGWSGTLRQLDAYLDPNQNNCQQIIPNNKVKQHVAMECVKRDYCPLQCPNFCGVTCEHDILKDHMRMCRLGVACEFNGVRCDGMFRREDQEQHTRQKFGKLAKKFRKQKTQKELQQQKWKLEKKFEEQERRFRVQEHRFHKVLKEQDKKFVEVQEKSDQNEVKFKEINSINLKRIFAIENDTMEKEKDRFNDWESPAMYTHICVYKFCIGINANE